MVVVDRHDLEVRAVDVGHHALVVQVVLVVVVAMDPEAAEALDQAAAMDPPVHVTMVSHDLAEMADSEDLARMEVVAEALAMAVAHVIVLEAAAVAAVSVTQPAAAVAQDDSDHDHHDHASKLLISHLKKKNNIRDFNKKCFIIIVFFKA